MRKTTRSKTIYWAIYSFLILCIVSCGLKKEEQRADRDDRASLYEYGICVDSLDVAHYTIGKGEYLSSLLSNLGFTAGEGARIIKAVAPFYPPSRLRAGSSYAAITAQDSTSAVRYIVFERSRTSYTVVDLTADTTAVYDYAKPVTLRREYTEGTITSTMWNAIIATGAPAMLALKLSDVYAWQIDFFDVKEGDSFRVMYDAAYIDDTTKVEISSIEGAVFTHLGKEYQAIPFRQDTTVREFFDENGNSLRKTFLKAPLDFFRITSRFSNSRMHPILKRRRPHHGVDYAAPVGTPVRSIGDGVVVDKGFQGNGAGNFLKVKHNAVYTTTYMHLSRFAKGIAKGRPVKQGDVIAYVGSTGLSTGPHLDFRVHKNNQPVNPLTIESPPCLPVRPELMDSFVLVRDRVRFQLDSLRLLLKEENE
jgi:murein DD-endopeptidase MepM/ murein hydrolase activator NlpD